MRECEFGGALLLGADDDREAVVISEVTEPL